MQVYPHCYDKGVFIIPRSDIVWMYMHMISEPSFVDFKQKQGGSFIFIHQTLRRETEFKVKESIRSLYIKD